MLHMAWPASKRLGFSVLYQICSIPNALSLRLLIDYAEPTICTIAPHPRSEGLILAVLVVGIHTLDTLSVALAIHRRDRVNADMAGQLWFVQASAVCLLSEASSRPPGPSLAASVRKFHWDLKDFRLPDSRRSRVPNWECRNYFHAHSKCSARVLCKW